MEGARLTAFALCVPDRPIIAAHQGLASGRAHNRRRHISSITCPGTLSSTKPLGVLDPTALPSME
jgi:hypothetical protein